MARLESYLPLRPASFHVLLALAEGPRHGASIREAVAELTDGAVTLWPVTLYGAIRELDEGGLIEAVPEGDEDARRRSWQLTRLGSRVLAAETARLRSIVEHAERAGHFGRA
jgi:DNA-binding PadR family transcriptional regulator